MHFNVAESYCNFLLNSTASVLWVKPYICWIKILNIKTKLHNNVKHTVAWVIEMQPTLLT